MFPIAIYHYFKLIHIFSNAIKKHNKILTTTKSYLFYWSEKEILIFEAKNQFNLRRVKSGFGQYQSRFYRRPAEN